MPEPYRVGVIGFSDGRQRVHLTMEEAIGSHARCLRAAIEQDPLLTVVEAPEAIHSNASARHVAKEMRSAGLDAAVFNIPVFAFPNFSLLAARILELPVLLSAPKNGLLPGLGGILAAHGSMAQIGIASWKLWGDPLNEAKVAARLAAFCRASGARERLRGSIFGVVGGRSIGMNTCVSDPLEWMRRFGVDTEQIDQLEMVRRANEVDEAEVERAYKWMTERLGRVSTEGKAAPQHVQAQIRQYLALRSTIDEFSLDFLSIKCHYDLSEYLVTACLAIMFLNDPYDWNGPKAPFVASCEADNDGALTMQILKLISGFPSLLFDVRHYDAGQRMYTFCNCGAMPSWYAARSPAAEENLAQITLEQVISKYAGGGAHFPFVCGSGEITLARLTRIDGQYRMFLAPAEFMEVSRAKMAETCSAWPHGFVRMDVEPEDFIDRYHTNHAHAVPGRHLEALEMLCQMMDIPVDRIC
jgi:L-fucose isomerase